MQYTINIIENELDELKEIIAGIKLEQPGSAITEQLYIENIVRGYLQTRLKNKYIAEISALSLTDLKTVSTTAKELKDGK